MGLPESQLNSEDKFARPQYPQFQWLLFIWRDPDAAYIARWAQRVEPEFEDLACRETWAELVEWSDALRTTNSINIGGWWQHSGSIKRARAAATSRPRFAKSSILRTDSTYRTQSKRSSISSSQIRPAQQQQPNGRKIGDYHRRSPATSFLIQQAFPIPGRI